MVIHCYFKDSLNHNLISFTLHNQIFSLLYHINKVTRKTGLPQPKMLQSAQSSDKESQYQGVVFFRKQFYQKHWNRNSLKCLRLIKWTTDSKLPCCVLKDIKTTPTYGMLSWHPRWSRPLIFNIPLFSDKNKNNHVDILFSSFEWKKDP